MASNASAAEPRWSVVVPFYNERDELPATLASLAAQTVRPLRLILVDNGSTDGSAAVARAALAAADASGLEATFLEEATPGQAAALETGIAAVSTAFVAICDADTRYAPTYLARAEAAYDAEGPGLVAVLGTALYGPVDCADSRRRVLKATVVPRILRRQCHAGGYAHTFRTEALKASGGYSRALWPYLRKDHELVHRVWKQGRVRHDPGMHCFANDRRTARLPWSLAERALYHATPFSLKDWFFYRFLAGRMAARQADERLLRQRPWEAKADG
ncbi:MAG: glycosyltransferase family 2 protein [Pseudomonadota bacterium]